MLNESDKKEIAHRAREQRKALGITQVKLAETIGCTQGTIVQIEGAGSFSSRLLRDVAAALNVREEWLRTGKGEKQPATGTKNFPAGNVHVERSSATWREVPVVSWATAGRAKDYEDMATYLDEKVVTECRDKNAFAVVVDGDSMEPQVSAGDRVVVSPNTEAQSGDLVIARTRDSHEVYLKKFLRHGANGKQVRLVSFNSDYPPLEFQLSDFRFIYPVVNLVRVYKHVNGG